MMKTIQTYLLGVAAVLVGVTACHNAEYSPLEGQGFILQTQTRGNASQTVTIGNKVVSADVNIRVSSPLAEDAVFTFEPDAGALEVFNARNSTPYVFLPADRYTLTDEAGNVVKSTTVAANKTMSPILRVNFSPLTEEMINSGQKYALALTARSADGKTPMLSDASTMVYALDRVVIQPVPRIHYGSPTTGSQITGKFGNPAAEWTEWTWECNLNIDQLGEGVGKLNNQAVTNIAVSKGTEIYIRFGDAPIDGRMFQVKTLGTQMNSQMLFSKDTWYHIALVCTTTKLSLYVNGELDNSMDVDNTGYQLFNNGADDFSIANGSMFKANMMISEWRFWTVARSQAELKNNMYSCDPATPGLLGYFKFNEGSGKDYADASGKGGHASSPDEPTWIPDVRIDGKSE